MHRYELSLELFPVMQKQPHRRIGMVMKKTTRLGLDSSISPIDEVGETEQNRFESWSVCQTNWALGCHMTFGKNLLH